MKKLVLIGAIAIAVAVVIAGVALWNYHEQPRFCGDLCHIMEPYLASWRSSPLLANAHAVAGTTCLNCHEPTIQEQLNELMAFVRGDYAVPLEERAFSREECLKCHEHESYEQIAELTADYTVNGEPINPHDYPINSLAPEPEAYTDGREYPDPHDTENGELECNECHRVHREAPGLDACTDCHHDGLFTVACDACHKDGDIVFSEQEFPEEACVRCHTYENTEQLVALTQDYRVNYELVNPHAYPADPEAPEPDAYLDPAFYDPEAPNPHSTGTGELACYPCHKNMGESSLDPCYGCHHDAIFAVGCDVCHKEEDYRERLEDGTG